jgi:hypothetical protein
MESHAFLCLLIFLPFVSLKLKHHLMAVFCIPCPNEPVPLVHTYSTLREQERMQGVGHPYFVNFLYSRVYSGEGDPRAGGRRGEKMFVIVYFIR